MKNKAGFLMGVDVGRVKRGKVLFVSVLNPFNKTVGGN
jgi:hypothetical protein